LQKCQSEGMDLRDVCDFLNDKGIAENEWELVRDYIKNPNYVNVLRPPQ
jgi:hypothetical protein